MHGGFFMLIFFFLLHFYYVRLPLQYFGIKIKARVYFEIIFQT